NPTSAPGGSRSLTASTAQDHQRSSADARSSASMPSLCRAGGSAGRLARRAPPHRSLLALRPELAYLDRGLAAQAGPAAPVDPQPASRTTVAGGDPAVPVLVDLQHPVGDRDQPREVADLGHRRVRVAPGHKARLGPVDVADPG